MYRYTSSYGITGLIIHYQDQNVKTTRDIWKYKFNFLHSTVESIGSVSEGDIGFMPLGMVKINDSKFHYIFAYQYADGSMIIYRVILLRDYENIVHVAKS